MRALYCSINMDRQRLPQLQMFKSTRTHKGVIFSQLKLVIVSRQCSLLFPNIMIILVNFPPNRYKQTSNIMIFRCKDVIQLDPWQIVISLFHCIRKIMHHNNKCKHCLCPLGYNCFMNVNLQSQRFTFHSTVSAKEIARILLNLFEKLKKSDNHQLLVLETEISGPVSFFCLFVCLFVLSRTKQHIYLYRKEFSYRNAKH